MRKDELGEIKEITNINDLSSIIEQLCPSCYIHTLFQDRPYDGQPQTDLGERGKQEVHGVTMRDLRDCFIRACFLASGLPEEEWTCTVYDLSWDKMDIIAVWQNMACEIEKLMGIFPNIRKSKTR